MTRCGNCNYPLICEHCGSKFFFADEQMYEAFYDRIQTVICPSCQEVLACGHCSYTYDAGKYEYEDPDD